MYGSAFQFFILIIGIICCVPSPMKCERILVIEPFPAKSHMTVFLALTRELASRGHEVLVISPFPLSKPMPNYTDINIMETVREHHEKITGEQLYEMGDLPVYFIPILLWDMGLLTTETVLRIPEVQAVLNDQRGFDLVIVEAFMNEAFYAFADHFKVNKINIYFSLLKLLIRSFNYHKYKMNALSYYSTIVGTIDSLGSIWWFSYQ
jgi:glucuronosyltransferase